MPPPAQLRVCVLASGSSGNCIHVESATTALLVDAGLSARETLKRMQAARLDPAKLQAICVSHEHSDHVVGLVNLHKKHGLKLYANGDTARAIRNAKGLEWNLFSAGSPFAIGDIHVLPFPLPHDAYDPVGFILSCGSSRVGIATDLGMPTQLARERLRGCQLVVMEANHDETLLHNSFRPWSLKQRILGRQGHLSNETAAELLADIAGDTLQQVFLAHLSRECNNLDLALLTVRRRLAAAGLGHIRVLPTYPDHPSEFAEG
ncbi:MAG: MBL fold metallo-hydrolase [Kiritimatiellia bacterium]